MAIYTKRGDKGKTGLYATASKQKKRISKESLEVRTLGLIDELNSFLGVAISFSNVAEVTSYLKEVQKNLLVIGSVTAGSKLKFSDIEVRKMEKIIDKLEGDLPVLSNFILPGGTVLASHLHCARSLSRRTERGMISLSKKRKVDPRILVYMNRLSDFLFMLARFVNAGAGLKEEIWLAGKRK